ncbi:glycosyltransferase family 4 protein [Dehalococcoidia bacterium]|nr:glycosyltransferase family 4 protein [Dehalococcoidia bacterium]
MQRGKVILVISHLLDRDVRLSKEMSALRNEGYTNVVICWDRECKGDKPAVPEECEQIRLKLKAPWGIRILPFLPIWWCFVFVRLLISRWDVVHAVNFDCIIPSVIAGILKRKPVAYEILDVYEDQMVLPRAVRSVCINVDKLFMRLASAVVVADEAQIEGVGGIPNPKVVPVYDSPPDTFGKQVSGYPGNQTKGEFTLFYAGVLYRDRRLNLDKVVEAIEDIEGVKLVIAGYGDLEKDIKQWSCRMPDKVEFLGKISYEDVIRRGSDADLFFILRDPIVPVNRYTCGSTLFNAMICGKPILANNGSSTAIKVYKENCGVVVDANNIEEIRNRIIKLRDNPELCEEFGANARKAYEQRYSWEIMGERLVDLYHELTDETGQGKRRARNNGELSRQ